MQLEGLTVSDQAFRSLMQKYGVKELALFGSRARGEHHPTSDVDLLVDFKPGARVDLFDFVSLKLELESLFGAPVDLVEREALKPRVRQSVLSDARSIYAV